LNTNNESKEKLTTKSVNPNSWRTTLYSPKTTPKVPDKGAWHIDDKWRTETQYTPRPRGRDHIHNAMRWREKESTTKHQQSQHDIHHETINMMQGRIVNTKRLMDIGTSTDMISRTGKTIQKPACDNDDDWSSSGPECGAKNDIEQLSEDSDELSEDTSDVRESNEDMTGSLPETVYMACMRDHYHYTLYRDTKDGEGPSQNNISYNGIYRDNDGIHWAYEEEFVECSNPTSCGLPVENHWDNGKPAEWFENVDLERYSKEEEKFGGDPESEEDPFVDKLELEVENNQTNELDDQEDEPTDESDVQEDKLTDESDD
jgi:hypothetical protein